MIIENAVILKPKVEVRSHGTSTKLKPWMFKVHIFQIRLLSLKRNAIVTHVVIESSDSDRR